MKDLKKLMKKPMEKLGHNAIASPDVPKAIPPMNYARGGMVEDNDMKDVAKLKVLKHLKEMASNMMGDDVKGGLDGMKKVTVAAPDTAGLKHGLDKAKDVIGQMGHDESMEDPEEEMHETSEEEHEEDMSPDEIDAEIAHLLDLKKQLTMKEGMR